MEGERYTEIEVIDKSDCVLMEMNYSPSKLMFYLFDGCLILHVMVDSGSWLLDSIVSSNLVLSSKMIDTKQNIPKLLEEIEAPSRETMVRH